MSAPQAPAPVPDPRLEGALRLLDEAGQPLPDAGLAGAALPDDETARRLYRLMRRARVWDDRALVLQRQGRIGVYPCFGGMEATGVGAAAALEGGDWVAPTYRGSALALTRGLPLATLISMWRGHPAGFRYPPGLRLLPFYVPIANQLPHVAGLALAEARRAARDGTPCRVALGMIGDGGTSEGDFHVGVNFAGAFRAPAIIVIENNGWAISTPTHVQTAAATLASRAEGYGLPGVRVDGNDVLAVHAVVSAAAARARRGEGPTLIEAVTYRILPHTSSDDPARYRSEDEARAWRARDPNLRLRAYLSARGLWDDVQEEALVDEMEAEIRAGLAQADAEAAPGAEVLFDHVYARPLPEMDEQRRSIQQQGPGSQP